MLVWPLLILALTILGWSMLLMKLDTDKQEIQQFSLQQSATLAQAYADHLARNFEAIDQIALHVKYEWELSKGTLKLDTARARGLFPSSELVLVTIVDRKGDTVTSTAPVDKPVNIADREHFKVHIDNREDILFISKVLIGRLSGRPVIQFSRKLTGPDGSFDGVVVVSVEPAFLALSFDFSSLGQNGLLAAVGEDGTVRVARVGKVVPAQQHPPLIRLPEMRSAHGSMLAAADWFEDGRSRFLSWQGLKTYPFMAIAGIDAQDMLIPYRKERETSIALGVLATLAALIIAILATVASARLVLARSNAKRLRDAYRMATESGNDGFFICEALHDNEGTIVDFRVMDCNRRGAELIRRHRDSLIGLRLSRLYARPFFTEVLAIFRNAMERGISEGEYQVPEGSLLNVKWAYKKLVRSGNSLAITLRDISDQKLHLEELERRGNEDALTSLHNRHWLHAFLPKALEKASENNKMLALLFIDIDGFKAVNDSMGHAAGDELLRIAASRLQSVLRPQDKVVRLGGDEFLIVLEDVEQQADASHIARRVLEVFGEKFKLKMAMHTVGVSVGISLFPRDGRDAKTLLQNADIAMYSAKESGKGQSRFYDPVFYDKLRLRLETERKLRDALDLDQFVMFYQPRLDMRTGRVCGLEALIRWNHPEDGLMEPMRFITIAEESGLILNLGRQAMEKVCAQIAQWSCADHRCVPVSINVSPRQFQEGNLKNILAACLARHNVAPGLVEIEVTESSMMGEDAEISMEMEALQTLGVKLLVDDFGTGYSSLSQLQRLDMDGLKIDRAFTSELGRSDEGEVFFTAIVTMAHALGMRVVAEGVETRQQVDILKRLLCDEIQGFYVSRPVPAAAIPALIENPKLLAA
ncbi:MAG TPA: EAL domain-containing protein [Noviherbaspirillum sp.]|uniref:bifunctional diguanylate cyclase/phosphodiesterase n=1 Tax=Noviherbaspirillum sp. TaxID=1926288 RepID=UPI002DDDA1AE|nr:EAL domain-containing protein [Noviherbaspirillum sp.]HEV2610537.1 EAL domain-containing protein [Noviherbaspirillum sp.]